MEEKADILSELLCMACLSVDQSLKLITDEKLRKFYISALNELSIYSVLQTCPRLCWQCEMLLKNVVSFKEQIKDSFRIIQMYSHENLYECLLKDFSRPPRLKVHNCDAINICPSDFIESEVKTEIPAMFVKDEEDDWNSKDKEIFESDQLSLLDIDEMKHSDYSENENKDFEVMLNSVTRKNPSRKSHRRIKKVKRKTESSKDMKIEEDSKEIDAEPILDGRIIKIELSLSEVLEEREKESQKERYTNAAYKCESCIIVFDCSVSYTSHVQDNHSKDFSDFVCPICKTATITEDLFAQHYKQHTQRYKCSVCGRLSVDLVSIQEHYSSEHEVTAKEYKCDVCGKVSYSIDTHRYHKDTHKARVECKDCDKTFSHRAGLMNHRLTVHEEQSEFPCPQCNKVFRWRTSLKRHLLKHDETEDKQMKPYCSMCEVSFQSVCSYQRHMRNSLKHVTQDQLKFICDHCNRRFADKTKLRDHIEEKHLHRTFQCSICQKPSKNRVALDQHIRNVHKGRPNNKMCHHCGKGFPTKIQLESHIRTHTGERPFICEFCPTTFTQQSNLYKHNRQVHMNIKSKRCLTNRKKSEMKLESERTNIEPQLEAPETIDPFTKPLAVVVRYSSDNGYII